MSRVISVELLLARFDVVQAAFAAESVKTMPDAERAPVTAGYNHGVYRGMEAARNTVLAAIRELEERESGGPLAQRKEGNVYG